MLFIKAIKTVVLSLLFLPITGCLIATGIIFALTLRSVPYVPDYREILTQILVLKVHVKFFIEWIKTPFAVLMFLLLVPINFILFMLYIPLLYVLLLYWTFKLVNYSKYSSIRELKPQGDDIHPNTYFLTYVYYIKVQTWDKAYLTSFLVVYKCLNLYKGSKSPIHVPKIKLILNWLIIAGKALLWFIVRFITSLPKAVIVDSYYCSRLFIVTNPSFIKLMRGGSTPKDFYEVVTARINLNVMPYLYTKLIPTTFKRIFKTSEKKYNFNPKYKQHGEFLKFLTTQAYKDFYSKTNRHLSSNVILTVNSTVLDKATHCDIKGIGTGIFHRSLVLPLSGSYDQHNFHTNGIHKFTKQKPLNFIAVSQTSKNPSNTVTTGVSDTKYENSKRLLVNGQSYTTLLQPFWGYETRRMVKHSSTEKILRYDI